MKLWGKSKKQIQYSDEPHTLDSPGYWVNWVSYCQDELEQVAQRIGWQPGEQPSPVIVATITPDPNPPRNADGMRVDIGGIRVGYTPRANHGQQRGDAPAVLVKNGRDILVWIAA